ncbi:MAG: HAD-IB family hydrolase [Henriciella sp.]|nr:HAD-IB family hydrolase [Henriciella sp.]
MPGTAFFDMDRTLTRSGTWSRYLFSVNKKRPFFYLRLPLLAAHAVAYKLGLVSRQSVKEQGLKTLTWAGRADLERAAERFADREIRSGLRRQALAVLERHRAAGDTLVMATAAAELVARPIGDQLGMDVVICTELEWSKDNRLTGKLAGANCYGREKLDRIRTANAEHDFAGPTVGYSDHLSDLPFLEWVDKGVAVNPSRGLAQIADKAGLRIEDWEADNMGSENA